MSASVENKAAIQWTIADKLASRDEVRKGWEATFNSNMAQVADKIAESITLNVFEELGRRIADSYVPPLSSDAPLYLLYSLALKRDSGKIKEWAQDGAQLQPFKEWFQVFEDAKQKRKEGNNHDLEFSSKSFVMVADKNIEISYFQEHMSKIGHRVAQTVTNNLHAFAAQPKNQALQSKVEWYRKAEKLFSNPSDFRDDELRVTLWINSSRTAEKQNAAENKEASSGSCILL